MRLCIDITVKSLIFIFVWSLIGFWYTFSLNGFAAGMFIGIVIINESRLLNQNIMGITGIINAFYKDKKTGKAIFNYQIDQEKVNKTDSTDFITSFPMEEIRNEVITFYDGLSERYFESTIISVEEAEANLNRLFAYNDYVSINEFYKLLGLPEVEWGDCVGWYKHGDLKWIDFEHIKSDVNECEETGQSDMECYLIMPFDMPDETDFLNYVAKISRCNMEGGN